MNEFKDIAFADFVLRDAKKLPEFAGTHYGAECLRVDLKTSDHVVCANRYVAALKIIKMLMEKYPKDFK